MFTCFQNFLRVLIRVIFARYLASFARAESIAQYEPCSPTVIAREDRVRLLKHGISHDHNEGFSSKKISQHYESKWKQDPAFNAIIHSHALLLRKLFSHFAVKYRNLDAMAATEFIYMFKMLKLCTDNRLTLVTCGQIYTAVTDFVGDIKLDHMNFEQFIDGLLYCAKMRSEDGLVSLQLRISAFFLTLRDAMARELKIKH